MRSLQVLIVLGCLAGGLLLLWQAPEFFMPARNPALGLQFDAGASRLLGAGLLALAVTGSQYLQAMYYRSPAAGRQLNAVQQRRYFVSLITALLLIAGALWRAEAGPNPDYRPPAHQQASARTAS